MKRSLSLTDLTKITEILSVSILLFIGYLLFTNNTPGFSTYNNSDVHRGFQRGVSVLNGVNPYLEFNPRNILDQEKVPGFFPLYFYFMAFVTLISKFSYVLFLDNLRVIVFLAYSIIGVLIYSILRKQSKLLAITGMAVFMFNRWTLNDAFDLKQDTYVLVMVLISLINIKKHPALSFLLFGVATGIKHLTIFLLPVFLVELVDIYRNRRERLKKVLLLITLILAPVIIPSIPYILATPQHFKYSLLYNVTRTSEVSSLGQHTGFDKMLVLYNQDRFNSPVFYALPRLPLICLLLLAFVLYLRKTLNIWQYAFISYLLFIAFNPVLFGQYYVWMMAFAPLSFKLH